MGQTTHFFLGANSADGFMSLYQELAQNPAVYVYFLKGGPGGGKSTFMGAIGEKAQSLGQNVEYILCSGDPDSLDGVYLPDMGMAWLDATAPHALEPAPYGVQGEYLHLGQFCHADRLPAHEEEIRRIIADYQQQYRYGYAYLAAAGKLKRASLYADPRDFTSSLVRKRAQSKFNRLSQARSRTEVQSQPVRRFLRAVSSKGEYSYPSVLDVLCEQLCVLESQYGLDQIYFRELMDLSRENDLPYIQCLHPLCPELTEALVYPALGYGVITAEALPDFAGTVRTVHLDTYLTTTDKKARKQLDKQLAGLVDSACLHLQKGNAIHDRLEQHYHPALDIAALSDFTRDYVHTLFA